MNLLNNRKFKHGSMATLITVLFLVIVVIINLIAGLLVDRFPLDIDLTSEGLYQLSDKSIDFLGTLDKDITIYALNDKESFGSGSSYYEQAQRVLDQYAQYSNRITIEYIDPVKNPTFTTQYPDLELATNDLLITCDGRVRQIPFADLFNLQTSYYGSYITSSKAEQTITSALMYVTSQEIVKVAVLTGHDEVDISAFTELLSQNNYEVVTVNLLTEEIPEDVKLAILSCPNRDLDESMLNKLDAFLTNNEQYGKNFLYFAGAGQSDLPNLNAFLNEWGINVGSGVVAEQDQAKYYEGNPFFPTVTYVDEDYTEAVRDGRLSSVIYNSKPLEILFTEKSNYITSVLWETSETSVAYPIVSEENATETMPAGSVDINSTTQEGPIPVLALSSRMRYEGTTPLVSNVVVSGSVLSVDQYLLSSTSFANSAYYLGLLADLTDREDSIYIEAKTLGGSQLGITTQQSYTSFAAFAIVIPLVLLVAGIVVWLRRKNK